MSDPAIDKARALSHSLEQQIHEMKQKLQEWQNEKARIDEFIVTWEMFSHGNWDVLRKAVLEDLGESNLKKHDVIRNARKRYRSGQNVTFVGLQSKTSLRDEKSHNSKKEDVAAKAREIILAAGRPVDRADLLSALREAGLTIEGQDPEKAMNTMLWRTRENPEHAVIGLRRFGYWVRELPYEPAGYDPLHSNDHQEDEESEGGGVFD